MANTKARVAPIYGTRVELDASPRAVAAITKAADAFHVALGGALPAYALRIVWREPKRLSGQWVEFSAFVKPGEKDQHGADLRDADLFQLLDKPNA